MCCVYIHLPSLYWMPTMYHGHCIAKPSFQDLAALQMSQRILPSWAWWWGLSQMLLIGNHWGGQKLAVSFHGQGEELTAGRCLLSCPGVWGWRVADPGACVQPESLLAVLSRVLPFCFGSTAQWRLGRSLNSSESSLSFLDPPTQPL